MDLTSLLAAATLFSILTYGIVDRLKASFPDQLTPAWTALISFAVAFAVPFVVAYSTFGKQVQVGDTTLDLVNGWGLLVFGMIGMGGSSVLNQLIGSGGSLGHKGAIGNIGQNQVAGQLDPNDFTVPVDTSTGDIADDSN